MRRRCLIMPVLGLLLSGPLAAETTCYGDGAYRVCTTVRTAPDGSMSVESRDSMGNTYSMDTDVDAAPNGDTTVRSRDPMGNSYEIESWMDSRGSHTRDSMGNTCTILTTGEMIGCD